MEPLTKKRKITGENLDHISNLPDCLLIEILSLLRTSEVVQTCLVCKRWTNLWATVPYLDFDFDDDHFGNEQERFDNFVGNFLSRRNRTFAVHTFRLNYWIPDPEECEILPPVETWVLYAWEHKVKNLEINLLGNNMFFDSIPSCIFSSGLLEHLQLHGFFYISDTVCLPKLKTLNLRSVGVYRDTMQRILSGCSALQTLTIKNIIGIRGNRFLFPAVKSLNLENCYISDEYSDASFSTLASFAPCIKYVKFLKGFDRPSGFEMSPLFRPQLPDFQCLRCIINISGVETLELYGVYPKDLLDHAVKKNTILSSLKHLVFCFCYKMCDFSSLSLFLKRCPKLETLCLVHPINSCEAPSQEVDYENSGQIEACACQGLKVINIAGYQSNPPWCVHLLEKLIAEWTKKIHGVDIIFKNVG